LVVLVCCCLVCVCSAKVAVVLSGGGAKGAHQVGALEYFCESGILGEWDMIVGTSIGALNSGALAQFMKSQQCSMGVPAMRAFWDSIEDENDVFESWSRFTIDTCLNPVNFLAIADGWYKKGGMCSTEAGSRRYKARISEAGIAQSDVQLFVSAAGLHNTNRPFRFTNTNPSIIDYVIASGALSPVFPPAKVHDKYYVDGGYFTNVPILKAIEEGATQIYVFLLSPLSHPDDSSYLDDFNNGKRGPATLAYLKEVVTRQILLHSELKIACSNHADVEILALIPTTDIGDVLGFTKKEIKKMREIGYQDAQAIGFVDLCEAAARIPGSEGKAFQSILEARSQVKTETVTKNSAIGIAVAVGIAGVAAGGIAVYIAMSKRQRRVRYDYIAAPVKK